ncbi:hypothetical protein SmJEL517_g01847 [Synchytrium microbalum]|uniref:Sulfide:quinone oxidoreductase, mitochondrial n=1 Tax=Synchytrium microbalum TaxID=1806994 RepID=A0A507C320_9FUNG|nr:uncharacterized protein SmJEL517_g01847 [Synchytrium microbalum]TPX35910.1 hypothetical protein SmJEL517_g01847 [Synchytrium microbalum]
MMLRNASRLIKTSTLLHRTFATVAPSESYKVVVIGGGSAGLSVVGQLARDGLFQTKKDICVIDPSSVHYYQPMWTFVGAGLKTLDSSKRNMKDLIPPQAHWEQTSVKKVDPARSVVITANGKEIKYDKLVLAAGLELRFDKIEGLTNAIGKDGVCSNYSADYVEKTYEFAKAFKGGNAIFTQPATAVKCAGAPQKVMYLSEEIFQANGVRDKTNVSFFSGVGKIFSVEKYANELLKVCKSRNINVNLLHDLVAVDGVKKEATFKMMGDLAKNPPLTVKYDFLHVTPPMAPPAFIAESGLANADGWCDVNKETTKSSKYDNIYSLGDSSSMPTSKTGAAAAAQSYVTATNLLTDLKTPGQALPAKYDGYTSCPLVTGKGKLILAEFSGYTFVPQETFAFDQSKERASTYYMTSELIPAIYWNAMVKRGLWRGPGPYRKLLNPFSS